MSKWNIAGLLAGLAYLLPVVAGEVRPTAAEDSAAIQAHPFPLREYPIMRPDFETLRQWHYTHQHVLPEAGRNTRILQSQLQALVTATPTSTSLLPFMSYPETKRSQGSCGDCWV